jgi:hypothetical protein
VNLSIYSSYLTKETAAGGLSLTFSKARNLAINAGIFEKEVIETILANAVAKAKVIEAMTKEKTKLMEAESPKS